MFDWAPVANQILVPLLSGRELVFWKLSGRLSQEGSMSLWNAFQKSHEYNNIGFSEDVPVISRLECYFIQV